MTDKDDLRHSRSRLPVGTRLPREQALLLALLASENRAAHRWGALSQVDCPPSSKP